VAERIMIDTTVSVARVSPDYQGTAPYTPDRPPPEYPFGGAEPVDPGSGCGQDDDTGNAGYAGVRLALKLLEMGASGYDTPSWNPLGELIRPGETVVLKPNFVRDFRETRSGDGHCLITHGSIIRAAVDYAYIALRGQGRIIIADAPQNDADFDVLRRLAGLDEIRAFYRREADFDIEVLDLRPERARKVDGVIVGHEPLSGDPEGYVKVDLGDRSAFAEIRDVCHRLYGAEYDVRELRAHHHDDVHEYLIAATVLKADCVLNLPKLKTHKKVGLTACLKNLVGINGNKNWLPHHREGTPAQGGDQFAEDRLKQRLERATVAGFKRVFPRLGSWRATVAAPLKAAGKRVFGDTNTGTIRSGNWHGNDTTWRMVLDLNRVLRYADADGRLHDRPVRRVFHLVDAIVAGQGNGPLDPTRNPVGLILAGTNPVAVDLVCAHLMGFDPQRLPLLREARERHSLPLASFDPADITVRSNDASLQGSLSELRTPFAGFEPPPGWTGHIERHTEPSNVAG
jgi:uncharacterized protein (DUF362 family)